MNIAIIGAARTRSTVLTEKIKRNNPLIKCHYEHYTKAFNLGQTDMVEIADTLFQQPHIVKILGHNMREPYGPSVFRLNEYAEIHLIERTDFFDQCCSLQVCLSAGVWTMLKYKPELIEQYKEIRNQTFTLEQATIDQMMVDIERYIRIKTYLNENNIPFKLYSYEAEPIEYSLNISHAKLDYPTMITNYSAKDDVQRQFNQIVNYNECMVHPGRIELPFG